MNNDRPRIIVYTDGGADPNPGPGGWAAILIHPQKTRELSGGEMDTTNNRMELTAAVEALKALTSPCEIDFYTDSQYLQKGISEWLDGWVRRGWLKSDGQPIVNLDLWQQLYHLRQQHIIHWQWVKGHAGNQYNERADQLASAAIPKQTIVLKTDIPQVYLRISGSSDGRPGACGWAAAIVLEDKIEYLQGNHRNMSPNGFYVYAAAALVQQLLPEQPIQFITNNSYLYDGITNWVKGWRKGGWQKPDKFRTEWQLLDQLNQQRQIQWIKMTEEFPDAISKALKQKAEAARQGAK